MTTMSLEEAQAHLPELIDRLQPGDELVLTRNEQPVARLISLAPTMPQPRFGSCKGKLTVVAEDEEHLKDFHEYMP